MQDSFSPRATFSQKGRRVVLRLIVLTVAAICFTSTPSSAEVKDPFDPFDIGGPSQSEPADRDKSAEQLIREASNLLIQERYLDARSKLLLALQKDPRAYKAHVFLANYYLAQVGHFRLAYKYLAQAENLFRDQKGAPPYSSFLTRFEHSHIISLRSQIHLNLDKYQAALDDLDEYARFGYTSDWYPGSRAWVLMKLGRLNEAIQVAQQGYREVQQQGEKGQILNMLGILLSMTGQRKASIDVFQTAIAQELSMGTQGQPATPLNNIGEVYHETFDEDKAESSWLKATGMPDGCDHILPALNLTILYLEQLNFRGAKKAIDGFDACIAQFPLRNGEEHKALESLARGRIDIATGQIERGTELLESVLENRQWFGKIGANENDLEAGGLMSLAQAFQAKENLLASRRYSSWISWFSSLKQRAALRLRAWWTMRRARQVLVGQLNDFEDLMVRNTDSLLEYQNIGTLARDFPPRLLRLKIEQLEARDVRNESRPYYQAYLAENLIAQGHAQEGINLTTEVLSQLRPRYDDGLRVHLLLLRLPYLKDPQAYARAAQEIFELSPAALRNAGFTLPVNAVLQRPGFGDAFNNTPFALDETLKLRYQTRVSLEGSTYSLQFLPASPTDSGNRTIKILSDTLEDGVNKLSDEVFAINLDRE